MYSWTETWMKRIKEYPQRQGLGIIAIVSNMNAVNRDESRKKRPTNNAS
jgi:hypothetical protein